jgi:Phytanoyl-CoA dioxygenase (PhyH)
VAGLRSVLSAASHILRRQHVASPAPARPITFEDLTDVPNPDLGALLDRPDLETAGLSPEQLAWRRDGLVILPKFMPDAVLDPYIAKRASLNSRGGWLSIFPYKFVEELRDVALYPPLMAVLRDVIGEDMLLHLALTSWISTQRNWHQDDMLNPPFVQSWYAACWFALDTITADSGPFEYIPGSHRWPVLNGEKVRSCLTHEELTKIDPMTKQNHWEAHADRLIVPAVEQYIARMQVGSCTFIAGKGDVLIWHGRLMHRGTVPLNPRAERRALITHYSGITHRGDVPQRARDRNGFWYADPDVPEPPVSA